MMPRSAAILLVMQLVCLGLPSGPALAQTSSLLQAGERIYREGIDPSGKPLRAEWFAGVPLRRDQVACITCHRASGMGSIEGQTVVPAVVGHVLYQAGRSSAVRFGPSYERRLARPAYTDETLARALRQGIDPAGQPIESPMPRFDLDDTAMAALIAYLKSLGTDTAPGVTDQEIHLATVVTDGVAPEMRRALLDVLEAFVAERNSGSRSQSRQTAPGVWTLSERPRWRLHVWELAGPAADWPRQLAAHYRRQPVFAMVGGVASGAWQPIHDFCEGNRLPCLFPSTDLPVPAADGGYTLYFSRGLELEAAALGQYLNDMRAGARVLQVVADDPRSQAAAAAFRQALRRLGMPLPRERRLPATADARWWEVLLQREQRLNLVLWLPAPDLQLLQRRAGQLERVIVSSTLTGSRLPADRAMLSGKVMAVHPFVLPERRDQQLARMQAWLSNKGIAPGDERLQAEAFFAANALYLGLSQMGDHYSREYLLERLEDMNESAASESIYPRISLGPGQRFAAKGAYLLSLPADGRMPEAAGWFIP